MSNDRKGIKLVSGAPIINTYDMISMHSFVQEANDKAYNKVEEYIDSIGGMNIYLKSIDKLKTLFSESKSEAEKYTKLKSSKSNDASKHHLELTHKILKIKEIIEVFLKGFAVVQDEASKDFMILLHNRFSFLKDNTDLFYITQNPKYMAEIEVLLGRLENTFERMLEILKTSGGDIAQEIKNAKLNV